MVLSLANAVAIFNKWKDDSAEILVVSESPFQQSRRGVHVPVVTQQRPLVRPAPAGHRTESRQVARSS